MSRENHRIRTLFVLVLLSTCVSTPVFGQQVFANWTSLTDFDFGTISGTASVSNPVLISHTMLGGTVAFDGQANFPDAWYTPSPPVGLLWSLGGVNNTTPGTPGSIDLTVTFSSPVTDPRFHFFNMDAASIDFGSATITRLSGNPEFEVAGAVVNSTPDVPLSGGCEDAMGGNPNGACGTVELAGSFTSLTVTITEGITGSDGFGWTVSIDPSIDVVAVPTASEWGLLLFATLLAGAAILRFRLFA